MLIGSHLSIAGGMHHALEKAHEFHFNTLAMFVRNQQQWHVPHLSQEAVAVFLRTRAKYRIGPIAAHGSYLLNLAGSEIIRQKSVDALTSDLQRCDRLGIEYLVIHPGAHSDENVGLAMVASGLDEVFARHAEADPDTHEPRKTRILIETTAGSGTILCWRFEQVQAVLRACRQSHRLGVCLDTCHVFAAGYDIRTKAGWTDMMSQFDRIVGLDRLCAMHMNDSKTPLGSRVDRHAHIGQGQIGLEGFASIVNDRRLSKVPLVLETPKGLREDGRDWDLVNAEALKSLRR